MFKLYVVLILFILSCKTSVTSDQMNTTNININDTNNTSVSTPTPSHSVQTLKKLLSGAEARFYIHSN